MRPARFGNAASSASQTRYTYHANSSSQKRDRQTSTLRMVSFEASANTAAIELNH